MAHWVMARPVAVLIPTLALLLLLGTPFLRLEQGIPDASILPRGIESREAAVALAEDFPAGETSPIVVLATVDGSPTDAANVQRLMDYGAALVAIDGIDTVEGPFANLKDPATGADLDAAGIAALFAAPRDQLPPEVAAGLEALEAAYINDSTVRLAAISPHAPLSPDGIEVVPEVRAPQVDGVTTEVGGLAAQGSDFMASQSETIPYAIAWTLGASALILFLLFGSVVIPIKAVIMTLLSITASFGALVFIFQDGNFANVLGFDSPGFTIAGNPIIMFSVLFGLSMDYEVLLLSRMQEAYRRTGDNTASVAEGLAKTAGVITGAALIMVTVFSAFALAESITIKSIGVGMAIAVLIDATIVRVLLVPATMRLMGKWNWWAPGRSAGSLSGSASATPRTSRRASRRRRQPGPGPAGNAVGPVDSRAMVTRIPPPTSPTASATTSGAGGRTRAADRACRGSASSSWSSAGCCSCSRPCRSTAASATWSSSRPGSPRSSHGRSGAARSHCTLARSSRRSRRRGPTRRRPARTWVQAGARCASGWRSCSSPRCGRFAAAAGAGSCCGAAS